MNRDHCQALLNIKASLPNTGGWKDRHLEAIRRPASSHGVERGMVDMLRGWAQYANCHRTRFESGIGEDGVLGPAWARVGFALRELLNGETGRLDCGTIDGFLCDSLKAEGFDPDKGAP